MFFLFLFMKKHLNNKIKNEKEVYLEILLSTWVKLSIKTTKKNSNRN